ncbi:tyrosine-type recombinase/integrase [Brevundimonas faecalis]|uniref:tyrosine-type recombinase/integrase n=1 Tax=Brevundimonas faecalis TaxID=947378 RepID=UPI00361380B2
MTVMLFSKHLDWRRMTSNPNVTPGTLTLMPSDKRSLGRYVVLKKRANGLARAYFQVPARLRPHGWLPAIPLLADRTLVDDIQCLTDEDFALLMLEGARLMQQLDDARKGRNKRSDARTFDVLIDTWQRSSAWNDLTAKTIEGYGYSIDKIRKWSQMAGNPDPTTLTVARIDSFLAAFNDRPTTKRQTLKALRLVMQQAVSLGWRTDNPASGIKVKVPKTKAMIWEQVDVDLYVKAARATGVPSIALIILLEWEIGQRLTDVRGFRPGMEYDSARGLFSFRQSKTDSPVVVEISAALRDMLAEAGDGHLFLFRNERTGKAYTENRLSKTFSWVRAAAVKAGGRPLVLRQLRHSCIVQLARAGCTVPEIASITGHTLGSVHSILTTYLPKDSTVARNAQIKRGIVVDSEPVENKRLDAS